MLVFVAERSRSRPRFDDELDAFLEVLAVVGGVCIVGELFATRAAHPPGNQSPLRDQIDDRELFRASAEDA